MNVNVMEIVDVILRALISLIALFSVTKLLGKKQVSQLSLFDYVIGISIGNFAAEMTTDLDLPYPHGVVAVLIFGLVAYLVSVLTMKSISLRRFFIGTPTVLIQEGKILMKGLKRVKFDVNDLLEECRGNGYFDISQIEYALMEANGKLSILKKPNNRTPDASMLGVVIPDTGLNTVVISDGEISDFSVSICGLTNDWVYGVLKGKGLDIKDVFIMTANKNKDYYIIEKEVSA